MERLTHEADFGLEDWEETLFPVPSDPNGAYNILDIAKYQGEPEFDEILKSIALRLSEIENVLGDDYNLSLIRHLVEAERDGRIIVMKYAEREGVARLRELAEADREGRCMVLPLKPGGEVYYIGWSACSNGWDDPGECGGCDNDCDSRRVVKSMRVHSYSWIVENFIERENHYYHTSYHDAEAALNGETYGKD